MIVALVRRDYLVQRSYRLVFALDLFYGVVNLLVFYFISKTFDETTADLNGAPSYFAFASIGIAITIVLQAASGGLAHRIREEQLTGTLEALTAQPITVSELAFGLASFQFGFGMLRAAFYLLLSGLFFGVGYENADWVGFVTVLLASGAALASIGVILGALVLVLKRGEILTGAVTFAMGLVSGAFFPVAVLPSWLQAIGSIMPTRFAYDGLRSAIFEGGGWGGDALALIVFAVIGLPIGVLCFNRGLLQSRRAGTISQY
ncbi:MAG TPA: ABC transporter permease [Gaiellaceae bacterium]|nr:ABC transporter permease [Gaiellaceae bacterium]